METWFESVHSDGTAAFVSNPAPKLFEDVTIRIRMYEERTWKGAEEVEVKLTFEPEIIHRPHGMVCVRRGPLFYSIPIKEKWEKVEYTENGVERKFPYCDYYIYPMSKWNYALCSDTFTVEEHPFDAPFSPEGAPVSLTVDMAEVEWDFNNGHCDRLPKSNTPIGDVEQVKMIPYGCTNLRMTEIPVAEK